MDCVRENARTSGTYRRIGCTRKILVRAVRAVKKSLGHSTAPEKQRFKCVEQYCQTSSDKVPPQTRARKLPPLCHTAVSAVSAPKSPLQGGALWDQHLSWKSSVEGNNSGGISCATYLVYFLTMASTAGREIMNREVAGSILTVFPIKTKKGIYSYLTFKNL